MDREYWLRQTKQQPLYPELAWSRPENRLHAGKLLIVGGSSHGFAAPARAYAESVRAGIGTVRALLPQSIQKIVGIIIENAEYAPDTPSGSFSQKALAPLLENALWADGVLFAGDLGRNSETAIVIEKFLAKSPSAATLTKDAIDYVTSAPDSVLHREKTALVLSLSQLQRLGIAAKMTMPITYGMDLLQLAEWLHIFTTQYAPHIVVKHLDTIFVAVDGQVSTTKHPSKEQIWRLTTASHASVWWLQNPAKPFQALNASVHSIL